MFSRQIKPWFLQTTIQSCYEQWQFDVESMDFSVQRKNSIKAKFAIW